MTSFRLSRRINTVLAVTVKMCEDADRVRAQSGAQPCFLLDPGSRKCQILKARRDVRVVEGARLEIALAICDGVLQISITVAKPTT